MKLRDEPIIGDGAASRVGRELQKLYLRPSNLSGPVRPLCAPQGTRPVRMNGVSTRG
jgi:hypothetical protein